MANTSTNISLTLPELSDTTKIREDFNDNFNIIDGRFSSTYMAVQAAASVAITGGSITGITDITVADGGTGASTLTDGGVLLGSGTGAITAMAVLTDGQMIVGNGTTDPVAESGATLRTSIGVAIGTNVQAYDAGLTAIAALAMTDSNMLVGNGTTWVLETGSTLLTSVGAASRALDNIASCAINVALLLGTSDAAALGSATKMWSDLFLASGGIINFNNGDVTLTHSSNTLTLGSCTTLVLGSTSITMTGSLADTTNRVTKGWFTNLESTNDITISGTALAAIYQPLDAGLTDIAALAVTNSNFIVGDGSNWVAESGSTARASMGVYQDYIGSSMIVSGGTLSTGTNAGTFKVAALTALLRATDGSATTGVLTYLTLGEQDNQAIAAADTTYYVILSYNDGVTPTITTSATIPNLTQNIPIGKVRKDGSNNVHFLNGGMRLQDGVRKLHKRIVELRAIELASGSAIAYSGTNNFTMETGVAHAGLNHITLSSYDSASTQFTYVYDDGGSGWTEALTNVIDFAHYDDGDGTLGNIGVAKYGVHWVYKHTDDGHVYVVYGVDSYSLAAAEEAAVPTIPTHLTDFGCLIGKIIAPQAGGSFTTITMVTETFFTGTSVSNHANLTNLDYASAAHTGFATSGANSDITSLTATTAITVTAAGGAKGIDITGATTSAQLYIGGSNILANGEQAIYVNCPSEDGATNAMWLTLGSTVTSGDVTGARIKVTTNATTGGASAGGQQTRGVYVQAIAAANDDAGQLIGGQFTTDVSAGSCVVYNAYAIYGHHSAGTSTTIGGDLFVGLLKSQTVETSARTVGGIDGILQIENEAIEGTGTAVDVGIHFKDNIVGDGFTIGIDMSDADIATADIRLQNGETISNATDGIIDIEGELDMNAHTIGFTEQTVTYASGTTTVVWTSGNKAIMTFGAGNITTFAFTDPTNPCNLVLKVVQDGTGSRTVTAWDTDIKWVGGTKPTLSTGANAVDICSFYWDGTNYHGVASLAFAIPA